MLNLYLTGNAALFTIIHAQKLLEYNTYGRLLGKSK